MPSLRERFEAAQDQSYFPRVRQALAITAAQVANEDPNTDNHDNRVRYAREVYRNPDLHIGYWMFGLTGAPTFGTGTDDPADDSVEGDNALLWTMSSLWNGYAGTGEEPVMQAGNLSANIF